MKAGSQGAAQETAMGRRALAVAERGLAVVGRALVVVRRGLALAGRAPAVVGKAWQRVVAMVVTAAARAEVAAEMHTRTTGS